LTSRFGARDAFRRKAGRKANPKRKSKAHFMERLKRRTDFRALAQSGARAPATAFVLQARRREEGEATKEAEVGQEGPIQGPVRVGFTVSKQVGTAVERNRVRRRLREIVRLAPKTALLPGHDYVLIGRRAALNLPFAEMMWEFDGALRRVHAVARRQGGATRGDVVTGAPDEVPLHRTGSQTGSPDRPRGEPRLNQPRRDEPQRGNRNRTTKPRQGHRQETEH
jgi:ribonuclease P protein component